MSWYEHLTQRTPSIARRLHRIASGLDGLNDDLELFAVVYRANKAGWLTADDKRYINTVGVLLDDSAELLREAASLQDSISKVQAPQQNPSIEVEEADDTEDETEIFSTFYDDLTDTHFALISLFGSMGAALAPPVRELVGQVVRTLLDVGAGIDTLAEKAAVEQARRKHVRD